MKAKYLLWPGPVTSRIDRQRHHVSASQLAALYGVNPRECVVVTEHVKINPVTGLPYGLKEGELISLHPDRMGRYELPKWSN